MSVKGFQFHKVRLKAEGDALVYMSKVFQFHKVRLKDPAGRLRI